MIPLHLNTDPLVQSILRECIDVPQNPGYKINFVVPSSRPICLVTGGVDSTILYFTHKEAGDEPIPIYFNYGQKYMLPELDALKDLGINAFIEDVNLPLKQSWKHIFPFRNFVLLCAAAHYTTSDVLFAVTQEEMPETGGDKSKRFISLMEIYLQRKIVTMGGTKEQNIAAFVQLMGDRGVEILQKTVSCFNVSINKGLHCGNCKACIRKWISFTQHGIDIEFAGDPAKSDVVEEYRAAMSTALKSGDFSVYSADRIRDYDSFFGWNL